VPTYFPPGDWLSEHPSACLTALREPALWRDQSIEGFRRRFRLLVMPSFSFPFAIRIDEPIDDVPEARFVRTDGMGGYELGRVAEWKLVHLEDAQIAHLHQLLGEARLDERLVEPRPHMDEFGRPDAEAGLVGYLDGTQMVIEDRSSATYAVITRHEGELDGPLTRLVDYVMSLTEHD
jgi:hypothetical protein